MSNARKENIVITEKDIENFDGEMLEELSEAISELISDKTGFCHTGFTFEIKVEAILDTSE